MTYLITIPPAALEAAKTAWYDNQHKGTDDRMASTCTAMLRAWPGMWESWSVCEEERQAAGSIILPLPQEGQHGKV